jgi:hypothetical protein
MYIKKNHMKIALLSLFTLLTFSACRKTVVNQTVNQAFSAIYSIDTTNWVQGQNPDATVYFYTTLSVPELDAVINQNGGVEVYISFDNGTTYETLPEVVDGVAYGSLHTTGAVTIDLRGADGGTLHSAISTTILAKVVLIDAQPLD